MLQELPTLRLRLKKPKSQKKVEFEAGTIDNEHLNKKKSKCKHILHEQIPLLHVNYHTSF